MVVIHRDTNHQERSYFAQNDRVAIDYFEIYIKAFLIKKSLFSSTRVFYLYPSTCMLHAHCPFWPIPSKSSMQLTEQRIRPHKSLTIARSFDSLRHPVSCVMTRKTMQAECSTCARCGGSNR